MKMSISRSFNQEYTRPQWQTLVCFLIFVVMTTVKCIGFHQLVFEEEVLEAEKWNVYFSSIGTVLILSSLFFLTRRLHWSIVVALLCDIWIIANIFYFRANGLFLNMDAIKLADGLERAHSSLLTYRHWSMYVYVLSTLFYGYYVIRWVPRRGRRNGWAGMATLAIGYACLIPVYRDLWIKQMPNVEQNIDFYIKNGNSDTDCGQDHTHGKNGWKLFLPFQQMRLYAIWSTPSDLYLRNRNILAYFPAIFVYDASLFRDKDLDAPSDRQLAFAMSDAPGDSIAQPVNLIVILVESWEGWTLDSLDGEPIMPYTTQLLQQYPFYRHSQIVSQVRHGVSGDGQMTLNTGLLPIVNGAACIRFPSHTYPNFAHYYPHSVTITPNNGWNQHLVTYSYGYKELCVSPAAAWEDDYIMQKLTQILDTIGQPFCVQAVTHTMHTPFNAAPDQHIGLPDDTPDYLRGYINSVRYTDLCLSTFYEYFKRSDLPGNTVVLITGDHTIFKQMMLKEFQEFATRHHLSFANLKNYCPLLVCAPEFKEGRNLTGTAYQMDLFPTLLPLIGIDNYFWKGFGIDLLDSTAVRHYTPEEAYQLSNSIICTDYFANNK